MVGVALTWVRRTRVAEAALYDGTNAADIMAYLTPFPGINPVLSGTTITGIPGAAGPSGMSVGDSLVRYVDRGPVMARTAARMVQFYGDDFDADDETDVIALGIAGVPTLLGGVAVNIDVTIRPAYSDTSYQATAALSGTVSLLAALSIISVTIISGSVVRVRVQNTGLLSLSGAQVVVTTIHN